MKGEQKKGLSLGYFNLARGLGMFLIIPRTYHESVPDGRKDRHFFRNGGALWAVGSWRLFS